MTFQDYNRPKNGFFSLFLNIDKNLRINTLIVIVIGVFLLPKTAYLSTITPEKLIEMTNLERNRAGLSILTANPLLEEAAKAKAQTILDNQLFSHEINGQKFSYWVKNSGYQYSIIGENLAIDFVTSEGVLKAWLKSPAHKKNIYNEEYSEIGIAVLEGNFKDQNSIIIAQIFGAPLIEKPAENISATDSEIAPISKDINFKKLSLYLIEKFINTRPLFSLLTFYSKHNSNNLFSFNPIPKILF